MFYALREVDGQDIDGCAADGGAANKYWTCPPEVLLPGVSARVEKPDNFTRFGINLCYIGSFIRVVVVAAQGQIWASDRVLKPLCFVEILLSCLVSASSASLR